MQKKLIALAVAAISAAPAFAQSNVTIYGRADMGYVNTSGNNGGVTLSKSTSRLDSGVAAGSRIGFKGTEDLGNGLKALFQYEFGTDITKTTAANTVAPAAGSGAAWNTRNSYVGLTGNFGTVVGGRLDGVRYGIFNKYDAFAGGTVGNFTQMTAQVDRANQAIAYISPKFSGFTFTGAYATHAESNHGGTTATGNEADGNVNDAVLNTLMLNYANGPIDVSIDYETVKTKKKTATSTLDKEMVTTIAGSYDFGVVKVSALWDKHYATLTTTGAKVANYTDYFFSAKAPFAGKWVGKATFGKVDDKTVTNHDATKFAIGVDYMLSKRTTIYADYGSIKNKNNAGYTINAGANAGVIPGVTSTATTGGVKGFDLGIGHNF